jgi:tryptophan-rich sensory protein
MKYLKMLLSIAICYSAGAIGSIFTVQAIPTWYSTLNKPSFNPPSWVFAPVWTLLYIMMGLSAYRIWEQGWHQKKIKIALIFFAVQLVLNASWSVIFFGWHNPGLALINIILLWLGIVICVVRFYRIDKWASYLLLPYLVWVSFATLLNYNIWILN